MHAVNSHMLWLKTVRVTYYRGEVPIALEIKRRAESSGEVLKEPHSPTRVFSHDEGCKIWCQCTEKEL
jgi:hypothetical protein